jgi:hypothetical protein
MAYVVKKLYAMQNNNDWAGDEPRVEKVASGRAVKRPQDNKVVRVCSSCPSKCCFSWSCS